MTERTGHRAVDRLIARAEERGLNIEIDRTRGTFVAVRIHNRGLAGDNGLNNANISLYVSFSRSKRGAFCGGHYYPLLGEGVEFAKSGYAGLGRALSRINQLYIVPEKRTEADLAREAKEREWYEQQIATRE